jgi:hypothetical protein
MGCVIGANNHNKRLPITGDVQRVVLALFTKAERAEVLVALERCRPGGDVARVYRAILTLCYRSVREVERLVEIANRSRRDLTRLTGVEPGL